MINPRDLRMIESWQILHFYIKDPNTTTLKLFLHCFAPPSPYFYDYCACFLILLHDATKYDNNKVAT